MKYKLIDIYKQIKEEQFFQSAAQAPQYEIFCDMDGVLCDFDRRFEEFGGMAPGMYESRFGTKKFWEVINNIGEQFWSKMPWEQDGKQLWKYISKYKPSLLSAPSKDFSSRYGKQLWVKENIPGTKLILSNRENKKNYSGKNKILIDDRSDNINDWVYNSGIGILHTSTSQTIKDLQRLGL